MKNSINAVTERFNKKHRTHCQRAYLCLTPQEETIISLNSIRGPVFVIATLYVYCEIWTEEFRYLLDKEGLRANSGFPSLSYSPPLHHIQLYLHATYTKRTQGRKLETIQKQRSFIYLGTPDKEVFSVFVKKLF